MQFHAKHTPVLLRKREKKLSINFPLTKKNYLERILDMEKKKKERNTFELQDTVTKEWKINVGENNMYCL